MPTGSETDKINDGYFIRVEAGDIVDTGSGPPAAVPTATGMWVPKGSVLNGVLVIKDSD